MLVNKGDDLEAVDAQLELGFGPLQTVSGVDGWKKHLEFPMWKSGETKKVAIPAENTEATIRGTQLRNGKRVDDVIDSGKANSPHAESFSVHPHVDVLPSGEKKYTLLFQNVSEDLSKVEGVVSIYKTEDDRFPINQKIGWEEFKKNDEKPVSTSVFSAEVHYLAVAHRAEIGQGDGSASKVMLKEILHFEDRSSK